MATFRENGAQRRLNRFYGVFGVFACWGLHLGGSGAYRHGIGGESGGSVNDWEGCLSIMGDTGSGFGVLQRRMPVNGMSFPG